ncbi:MAG TPA: alpha-amylase family glycosyl hydrolase [Thermoanaerobaculia bacterium]|nr:alpha-amylase family glycosyl hydrolase [Thermoanaerobaculia bacterium]
MPNRSRPSFPYLLIPCLLAYGALRIAAAAAPATTPATPQTAPAAGPWTRGAVLYTVFVPSFADSNGDGRGDLPGLLGELDYLNDGNPKTVTDLGVDALWLRGIAHPTAADPDLGRLRAEGTQRGLRIVVEGLDELPVRLQPDLAAEIVAGVKAGEASGIARRLAGLAAAETGGPVEALLLAADGSRLATRLAGDAGRGKSAAAILLTLPGTPVLDYGDEIGLASGKGKGDDVRRTPMPWVNVAAEAKDPNSLLSTYRYLIRARHNSLALRQGSLKVLSAADAPTPILAYLRDEGKERVLVVHNLGGSEVDAGPYGVAGMPDALFASPGLPPPKGAPGAWRLHLPPHGSGVYRLR